jgi:hypothetical protein
MSEHNHEEHVHGPNCSHGPLQQPFVREAPKVGRNDPCPCGSGKKFKKCCGGLKADGQLDASLS